MIKNLYLIFILVLIPSFSASAEPTRSVVYKEFEKGKELKLYIFEPEKKVENRACVVFFFGGGWVGGSPKQFYQQAERLAKQGILAISADYRTKKSHGTTPQHAVEDAKTALSWVRAKAKDLGIDPNKIVAAGGSAGGHLAACAGVIEGFDVVGSKVSSVPNAMVLYNPVLDTTKKGYGAKSVGDKKTEISPCHHVRKGIVPTLVMHGTADTTVPFENAERFTKLMKEAGNDCTLIGYKGAGHGFFNGNQFRKGSDNKHFEQTMKATEEFLRRLEFLPKK